MALAPLRILQIMRAPVGGLFRHVADLTHALAARGHEVGIVADSLSQDGQTQARLDGLAKSASLGIHRLPMPRLFGVHDLITPFRIRRLAQSLDVSILHGHGAKGGFGARLAGLGSRQAAMLYTPHGGALHYDPRSATGRVFMAIERGLLSATDALIFESAYARRTFASHVGMPKERQAVIHNGLATEEFEPVLPIADAADFVFVGELRMLKGIDLVAEALSPLRRPDGTPATLIMAGDGPDRAWLETRIAQPDLAGRVTLAGVQPAREMFARGRVVVVPSRAESLPYVVLEAAAAGRPVIATAVGGIPEIFGPTAELLVAPDSVDALRVAMSTALAKPERAQAAAKDRLRYIGPRFSVTTMVDAIEALYRDLPR